MKEGRSSFPLINFNIVSGTTRVLDVNVSSYVKLELLFKKVVYPLIIHIQQCYCCLMNAPLIRLLWQFPC